MDRKKQDEDERECCGRRKQSDHEVLFLDRAVLSGAERLATIVTEVESRAQKWSKYRYVAETKRRRNRTYQALGCNALPVLKTT